MGARDSQGPGIACPAMWIQPPEGRLPGRERGHRRAGSAGSPESSARGDLGGLEFASSLKRAFEVGASFFGQGNDQSGAQESKRLYSVRGTMVRDAYSAGGQPQQADGGAAAQPLELHSSTANLTQELSLLLAAS